MEWSALALPWILVALCIWGIWKKVSYRWLFPILGLSAGPVAYLAYDGGERPAPPEIGKVVSADSKSYEAYRWFLKGDPLNRLPQAPAALQEIPPFPADSDDWSDFFGKHRDIFIAGWKQDALGREWTDVMAANVPDGIFPPQGHEGPSMAFSIFRRSAQLRWGYAQVLVLDNRPDDAVQLLLPFLRANYHLQRGGSSLMTEMIALVCVRTTYEHLETLAYAGRLSPALRSEIAATLREAPLPPAIFKNAFLGEEIVFRSAHDSAKGDWHTVIETIASLEGSTLAGNKFLWPLFFNPHQSEREYSEFLRETCRLAELRQLESVEGLGQEFREHIEKWRIKNPLGQLLMQMSAPAFGKVTQGVWQAEDRRKALLQTLEAP